MNFEAENILSIWAGTFADEADLFDYVDWKYDENDDSHCAFAAHSGIGWFDHDFQEANFIGEITDDWIKILQPHSFSSSFASEAAEVFKYQWQNDWNSIFILYDCDYKSEKALPSEASRLHFIGSFPYRRM